MRVKIAANEPLFDEWTTLLLQLSTLKSAVQNDMEVERVEILEWRSMSAGLLNQLDDLRIRTLRHIEGGM